MTTETFDPSVASGERDMRGSRPLKLNELLINGDGNATEVNPGEWKRNGGYFRKRLLVGNPKDQKPKEENLGERVSVVFLKVRRRLVERGEKGKIVRSTGEHNSPKDSVTLYEADSKNKVNGVAEDLRKQFENLRTVQIVYALLATADGDELVRLIVKGSSLGSEVKAKDVMSFYDYISSFRGDDHFYQFETILTPVKEQGAQPYYAINFQRGDKLSEEDAALALSRMKEVHDNCVEIDTKRAMRIVEAAQADGVVPEEGAAPAQDMAADYPTDINPDDIPF